MITEPMDIITGRVIAGKNKGRILGFPTANIVLNADLPGGVYSGSVRTVKGSYRAAIFIGPERIFEAHLLDFSGDLYGQEIQVEIGEKLRDIRKFESDEDLKKQIGVDVQMIRNSH